MRTTVKALALGAALALGSAACGSTAQVGGDTAAPVAGGGLAPVAGAEEVDSGGTSPTVGPATSGGVTAGGAGAPAGGTPSGGRAPGASAAPTGSGGAGAAAVPHADRTTGVTDDTIKLGLAYAVQGSEANAAIGGGAATSTDTRKARELLLASINDAGGIHGRKIEPVWHEMDALSNETSAERAQRMCAAWTEDDQVFAALGAPYEQLLECMADEGAPMLYSSLGASSAQTFEQYPLYLEPGNASLSRAAIATVESLVRRDYFDGEVTIGVVAYDDPDGRETVDGALLPALARHGLEPTEIAYVTPNDRTTDVSGVAAATSSAVLRFRSSGVDHVLIVDTNALLSFVFMQQAHSQGYRPRYGLNTQNGNTALSDLLASSGSQDQLIGALSVGWLPVIDTHEPDDPHNDAPERNRCLQLMRDGGLTSFDSRNAMAQALGICDEFWFLVAALEAAGRDLNVGTFIGGANTTGSFASPLTLGNRIAPDKHDGVDRVADMAYAPDCRCFRYTGDPVAMP